MPLFFFSSRRRHTRCGRDWSSDVCSSDLPGGRRASQRDPVLSVGGGGVSSRAAHHVRAALPVWQTMSDSRVVRVAIMATVIPALAGVVSLAAQDSQFGIRGLGTPGRFETVRARSTGGAFGPFDPMSPLAEASLG